MKKSLYIFLAFLLVLSCFSLVLAQETTATTPISSTTPITDSEQASSQTTQINQKQVKDVSKQLATSLNDQAKDVFQNEITLPSYLEMPAKIVFGLDSPVVLKDLIIVIGVWIMLFIIILDILSLMPLMNEGVPKYLGAVIVTILSFMSGVSTKLALWFYNLIDLLTFLNDSPTLKLIIAILIAVGIVFGATILKNKMQKEAKKTSARIEGAKAGAGIAVAGHYLDEASKK
jgi:hypothetical protein